MNRFEWFSLNPESPRARAVIANLSEILHTAESFGATSIGVSGSVASGRDHDGSDIDLYVLTFAAGFDAHRRATRLDKELKRLLLPHSVDVFGLPGFPMDPTKEASMRNKAIDLRSFLTITGDHA